MPPVWFDEQYYGQQKVIQMNAINYEPVWLGVHGAREWNFALYAEYLEAYRLPDGSPVSAWENFLACNGAGYAAGVELADINVSCNPLFDPDYYCQSVADWANAAGYGAGAHSGAWTPAAIAGHILHDLGMSLWEHFRTFGLREQLNPSSGFDTHAYLQARARAMSADGQSASIESAIAALEQAGLNPVMDYEQYGRAHGIEAQPVVVAKPDSPAGAPASSGGAGTGPVSVQPGNAAVSPGQPENPGTAAPDPENPEDSEEGAGKPEEPDDSGDEAENPGGETEKPGGDDQDGDADPDPDSPFIIHIEQEGNVTVPALASQGEDISVYVDAAGLVNVSSLNALGGAASGNVSLVVPNGNLGDGNAKTVIRGQDVFVDLGGAEMPENQAVSGYPRVEIWATGTISATGCNDYDWFSVREIGPGHSEINLDDGKDIFELFDMSATCAPAILRSDADLHINLGTCWDQLYIGDLAVQGGGIQTIGIDLGNDLNYETISLGRVTAGKLILSMENPGPYDEITTRRKIAPAAFEDGDAACAGLAAFGIDAAEAELGVWHDRVRSNGLVDKAYDNAAIYANDNTYVIYGNVLLELQGIGAEDYESA